MFSSLGENCFTPSDISFKGLDAGLRLGNPSLMRNVTCWSLNRHFWQRYVEASTWMKPQPQVTDMTPFRKWGKWVSWRWRDGATGLERLREEADGTFPDGASHWLYTSCKKTHTKGFSDALGEKTLLFHRNAKDLQFGGRNSGLFPNPVLFPWNEKNEMPAFTCLGSWVSTNQKQAAHKVLLKLELCLVPKIHLDEETFKEVWSLSNYLIMFSWNKHIS